MYLHVNNSQHLSKVHTVQFSVAVVEENPCQINFESVSSTVKRINYTNSIKEKFYKRNFTKS